MTETKLTKIKLAKIKLAKRDLPERDLSERDLPEIKMIKRNRKQTAFVRRGCLFFVLICLCMIQKMIPKLWNKLAAAKTRRRSGAKIIFFRDRTYYVADDWKNQFDGGVEMDLMLELEHAKCQWKNMQNIYNEVSDPALIDAVIYQMIAAEHRYEHLLQLAKRESLTCENIPIR